MQFCETHTRWNQLRLPKLGSLHVIFYTILEVLVLCTTVLETCSRTMTGRRATKDTGRSTWGACILYCKVHTAHATTSSRGLRTFRAGSTSGLVLQPHLNVCLRHQAQLYVILPPYVSARLLAGGEAFAWNNSVNEFIRHKIRRKYRIWFPEGAAFATISCIVM